MQKTYFLSFIALCLTFTVTALPVTASANLSEKKLVKHFDIIEQMLNKKLDQTWLKESVEKNTDNEAKKFTIDIPDNAPIKKDYPLLCHVLTFEGAFEGTQEVAMKRAISYVTLLLQEAPTKEATISTFDYERNAKVLFIEYYMGKKDVQHYLQAISKKAETVEAFKRDYTKMIHELLTTDEKLPGSRFLAARPKLRKFLYRKRKKQNEEEYKASDKEGNEEAYILSGIADGALVQEIISKVRGTDAMQHILQGDTERCDGVEMLAEHLIAEEKINVAEFLDRIAKGHASQGFQYKKPAIYCCIGIGLLGVLAIGMRAYRKQTTHKKKSVDRAKSKKFF